MTQELSEEDRSLLEAQEHGVLYKQEFAEFPPLTGAFDEEHDFASTQRIARRARALLTSRTDAQVEFIAEFCNVVVSQMLISGRVMGIHEDGSQEKITPRTAWSIETISLIKMVCANVRDWSTEDEEKKFSIGWRGDSGETVCYVDALTDVDVLATNALVQVVRALEHKHVDWAMTAGIDCAMTALECVVMAEHAASGLASNSLLERYRALRGADIEKRISESVLAIEDERARALNSLLHTLESRTSPEKTEDYKIAVRREIAVNAAKGRWAPLETVKTRAVELFQQHNHLPSRAAAVRKIEAEVRRLAKEAGFPLSEDHGRDTIEKWVAPHDPRSK